MLYSIQALDDPQATYCQNRIENAIITQQIATYGLLRSPIRAAFQNIPV